MHGMAHPEQSPHDVASHIRRGSSHARDQLGGIELCGCQRHLVLQGNYLGVLCDGHVRRARPSACIYMRSLQAKHKFIPVLFFYSCYNYCYKIPLEMFIVI